MIITSPPAVPAGTIALWSGTLANIPVGWLLCNGASGTPDLRDRFVVGASAGADPGTLGGGTTHTHTAHPDHVFTQPSAHAALATHQHEVPEGTAAEANVRFNMNAFGNGIVRTFGYSATGVLGNNNTNTDLSQAISGGTPSAHAGAAVDAHSAHNAADSRPAFYSIAYIQKQ